MPLKQMGDLGQVVVMRDWTLGDDDMTRYALSRSNVSGLVRHGCGGGAGGD